MKPRRFGKGRFRRVAGQMNGLESDFSQHLEMLKFQGDICEWYFESVTLMIAAPPNARPTRYTPDFSVYTNDMELVFYETKGFMREDARIKLKCAAAKYPHRFILVQKIAKRDGGGWKMEEF